MKNHEVAIQLAVETKNRDLNEADTRHQIIDRVLHEIFGWPRNRVKCEAYIKPGFADYVLVKSDDKPLIFIEAKRESHYFTLPHALSQGKTSFYAAVKTLLTDANISDAMLQVKEYCANVGCEIACVTNGSQWIFFRSFQRGEDWRNLKAFVVNGLNYFSERFTEAHNYLSYVAITESSSLRRMLLDQAVHSRELYYPKAKVNSYEAPVDANRFASSLRPIAEKYFGVINVDDMVFMDQCYVSDREYNAAFSNARQRLQDALTPFLESYGIQNFQDGDSGGGFSRRLQKGIVQAKRADVVVLFGGKGVGKSTFLRRLLFHKPPQVLKKHAVVAYLDLLTDEPNEETLTQAVWSQLILALDEDAVLQKDRTALCALFDDKYQQALRQDLYGLVPGSLDFNLQLNSLVKGWQADLKYVATRLAQSLKAKHKAAIIVVDNTDQFTEQLQDKCFSIAQEISAQLGCLVVISMREERFYASSIHGILDAYQNSGFHITSPQPREVFLRRIRYVRSLLAKHPDVGDALPERIDAEVLDRLFKVFEEEFSTPTSHLASFLSACSHGNIRLALELFRGFCISGYTNVQEMTSGKRWTLQIHQVLKPFMIPSRFFYEEKVSRIPNLFQIRSKNHGSHFTALRILSLLMEGQDNRNPAFTPIAKLRDIFIEHYSMKEDLELNLDMLLQHGLIEANNRLERFATDVDSVRATAYGSFMRNALTSSFTYIELTCLDCAITDQEVSNVLTELSNDEYRHFLEHDSLTRIEKRLQKAETFVGYLEKEEASENDRFGIIVNQPIIPKMRTMLASERIRVLKSARKNAKFQRSDFRKLDVPPSIGEGK